jgi:hypothetical protein
MKKARMVLLDTSDIQRPAIGFWCREHMFQCSLSLSLFIFMIPSTKGGIGTNDAISGRQLLFAGFCFAYSQLCSPSRKKIISFYWLSEFCILGKISAPSILFTAFFHCKNRNLDMACFAMSRIDLAYLNNTAIISCIFTFQISWGTDIESSTYVND